MQDLSQQLQSRVHSSCLGQSASFFEDVWVAWSAIDGH